MANTLTDTFTQILNPAWTVTEVGMSKVSVEDGELKLHNPTVAQGYTNAQITDYDYKSFDFHWKPPLRMTVTARASGAGTALRGTAGFGFWNHPFSPDVEHFHRRVRLPQAIWFFFGAPPNAMNLAHGIPGDGWKAALIDAGRPTALALVPLAIPAVALMQIPALYNRLYPSIQRALAIGECLLDDKLLAETHTYTLEWQSNSARFYVDDRIVYDAPYAPRGACGFVAWIDNQYAIVSPRGTFGSGVVPLDAPQTLWLSSVHIETLL
jgi:hypothetical protein